MHPFSLEITDMKNITPAYSLSYAQIIVNKKTSEQQYLTTKNILCLIDNQKSKTKYSLGCCNQSHQEENDIITNSNIP